MQTASPANTRVDKIRSHLNAALQPSELEITDDSHLHAGHAGAREGKGHYSVRIYRAVADMMHTDIHALSIIALAPDEAR